MMNWLADIIRPIFCRHSYGWALKHREPSKNGGEVKIYHHRCCKCGKVIEIRTVSYVINAGELLKVSERTPAK